MQWAERAADLAVVGGGGAGGGKDSKVAPIGCDGVVAWMARFFVSGGPFFLGQVYDARVRRVR